MVFVHEADVEAKITPLGRRCLILFGLALMSLPVTTCACHSNLSPLAVLGTLNDRYCFWVLRHFGLYCRS